MSMVSLVNWASHTAVASSNVNCLSHWSADEPGERLHNAHAAQAAVLQH
jgi:hypothetical protein